MEEKMCRLVFQSKAFLPIKNIKGGLTKYQHEMKNYSMWKPYDTDIAQEVEIKEPKNKQKQPCIVENEFLEEGNILNVWEKDG